jgi:glycine cleavage system regulatory protein
VLAAASMSHSGAIASSKLAMLKEAVCFLLVIQIEDFI